MTKSAVSKLPSKSFVAMLVACLMICVVSSATAAPPEKAQPIMTVEQVRVGMKGYGLTVFHGTKIEPFNVEVVSVNANETPGMAVIWVRCPDERMVFTGPVQGMSGSPIYLWDDQADKPEERTIGEGGKLIGAFAFGYGNTNDCIVGVQPIENMRNVSDRATAEDRPELAAIAPAGSGYTLMQQLLKTGQDNDASALTLARQEILADLYKKITPKSARKDLQQDKTLGIAGAGVPGQPMRMMMPMAVASPQIAKVLRPTLEPMGIQPFAADPSALGGPPPKGFDTENVELEPGSALVVPYAWGDADLMGIGTVTDVLPDGTVLGFGHSMDGVGVTAVPMATGYVHFIVSLRTISYKRGGTLAMAGTIIQDEEAAVAGVPENNFSSAPVKIKMNIEGQPEREYNYEVLNHPTMTPMIAAAVIAQSATAVQGAPMRNTSSYTATAKFTGGHELTFSSADINTGGFNTAMDMAQVVGAVTQNPFEEVDLESIDVAIDVDYGIDAWEIAGVRLDRATAAPGETVKAIVKFQGLQEEAFTRSYPVKIPDDAQPGELPIIIGGAETYTQFSLAFRPYLSQVDSVDDLMRIFSELFSTSPRSLYIVVPTTSTGVALSGQAMPNLPASKAAILTAGNPSAQFYQAPKVESHKLERLIVGGGQVQITVERPRGSR